MALGPRSGATLLGIISLSFVSLVATVLVNPVLPSLGLLPVPRLPQVHHLVLPQPERPVRRAERRYLDYRRALTELADRRHRPVRAVPHAAQPTRLVAYFVNWDDTSFTSLKQNIARSTCSSPSGCTWESHGAPRARRPAPPGRGPVVRPGRHVPSFEIVPLVNNFNPASADWDGAALAAMLAQPGGARATRSTACSRSCSNGARRRQHRFREPARPQPPRPAHVHARALRAVSRRRVDVSQSVPLDDPAFDYKGLAAATDYLVLMAYDEHAGSGEAGPLASQAVVRRRPLERRLEWLDAERVVVAVGNYGYDWIPERRGDGNVVSFQEAMRTAADSEGALHSTPAS